MDSDAQQAYFQNQFFELVLKKSLSLQLSRANCYLELMEEGRTLCLISLLYENTKGFTNEFVLEIENLEARGLFVDRARGQIFIARKYDFNGMTPQLFSMRVAQFLSEIQSYRKDVEGFRQVEYAYVRKN
jgi:hypothetical protein